MGPLDNLPKKPKRAPGQQKPMSRVDVQDAQARAAKKAPKQAQALGQKQAQEYAKKRRQLLQQQRLKNLRTALGSKETQQQIEKKRKARYDQMKNMLDFKSKTTDEQRKTLLNESKIGTLQDASFDDKTLTIEAKFEATRTKNIEVTFKILDGGKIELKYDIAGKEGKKTVDNWASAQVLLGKVRTEFIKEFILKVNKEAEKIHMLPQNDRLKMITGITNKELQVGKILKIKFSTKELEEKVGAKNILPAHVRQIEVNGKVGYRQGLNGNFYTRAGQYVAIYDNDSVEIQKILSKEETLALAKKMEAERLNVMEGLGISESKDGKMTIAKKSAAEAFSNALKQKNVPKETILKELRYITETARDYGIDPGILISLRMTGVIDGKFPRTQYDLNGRYIANAMRLYEVRLEKQAENKKIKSSEKLGPVMKGNKFSEEFLYYALPRLNLFNQPTNEHQGKYKEIFEDYGYKFKESISKTVKKKMLPYKRDLSEALKHKKTNEPIEALSNTSINKNVSDMRSGKGIDVNGHPCSLGTRLPNKYCARLVSAIIGLQPNEASATSMYSRSMAGGGKRVEKKDLKPGHLVFFTGTYGNQWSKMTHVGYISRIATINGKKVPIMIHQGGFTAKEVKLQGRYWDRHFATGVSPSYSA